MRIDTHISLWQHAPAEARLHPHFPGDDRDFVPAHIEPILARNRFDGAIVFSSGSSPEEAATLAEWCSATPALAGLSARWPDGATGSPPAAHLLKLQAEHILRGVWTHASSVDLVNAARFCHQHGLALDVLPDVDPSSFRALLPLAAAKPSVPIVLTHAATPPLSADALRVWQEQMRHLAQHEHVYCKLSALWSSSLGSLNLATLQSLFLFLLESFGERRILFGSDWPYCLPEHSWKECLARFTQTIGARTMDFREWVLGDNAARVYGVATRAD